MSRLARIVLQRVSRPLPASAFFAESQCDVAPLGARAVEPSAGSENVQHVADAQCDPVRLARHGGPISADEQRARR